jgi:hypothetical protein
MQGSPKVQNLAARQQNETETTVKTKSQSKRTKYMKTN